MAGEMDILCIFSTEPQMMKFYAVLSVAVEANMFDISIPAVSLFPKRRSIYYTAQCGAQTAMLQKKP